MKKKIIIAVSLLMLTSFTACGGGSGEVSPENITEPAEVQTETEAEITEEDAVDDLPEEDIIEDVEDEEEQSDSAQLDGVFYGSGYTMAVDSAKWLDFSQYIGMVSEFVEGMDTGVDLNAQEISEMSDALFYYNDDLNISVNVVKNEIGEMDGIDISLFAPIMEAQYNNVDGYTYLGGETIDLNGNDCLKLDVSVDASIYGIDENLKMTQYMLMHGANQYVITYSAMESKYDLALDDFKIMLNTLKFDDQVSFEA